MKKFKRILAYIILSTPFLFFLITPTIVHGIIYPIILLVTIAIIAIIGWALNEIGWFM